MDAKENLRMLAEYLSTLPEDEPRFDMTEYYLSGGERLILTPGEAYEGEMDCGAVACAVGHGPFATKIPPVDKEWWTDYSARVFNAIPDEDNFTWMFDANWSHVDNTPEGAALRIKQYINAGVPEFFDLGLIYVPKFAEEYEIWKESARLGIYRPGRTEEVL